MPTRGFWGFRRRSVGALLFTLLIFAAVTVGYYRVQVRASEPTFVDAKVYAEAVRTVDRGGDAYLSAEGALPFVYPPALLKAMVFVADRVSQSLLWRIYLALSLVCFAMTPVLLGRFYIRSEWLSPAVAVLFLTLQPGFTGEFAAMTGNFANIIYPVALALGALGLFQKRWVHFFVFLFLAAQVKPTFLTLLLLPLLAGERKLKACIACVVAVGLSLYVQRSLLASDYASFQRNVLMEVVGKGDAGFNVFAYLGRLTARLHFAGSGLIPAAVQIGITGLLVLALILLRRTAERADASVLWLPLLVVAAVLANPRMQHIDSAVAIVPALFLCVEGFRRLPRRAMTYVWTAGALVIFLVLSYKQTVMGLAFFLYASVGVTLLVLARERQAAMSSRFATAETVA